MVPFFTFYSMFGFQRVGDLIWQAADARTRGFLMAATAGRTTLLGEGLQHQDGHSLVLASTVPVCQAYDPAFAYETAAIIRHGIDRMYGPGVTDVDGNTLDPDVFYYLTLYNENHVMPARPDGVTDDDIVSGLYRWAPAPEGTKLHATILFSGSAQGAARAAVAELAEKHGVGAELWSATSYKRLREEALAVERWNRLHPEAEPRTPEVARKLADADGPVVAVTDFMRAVPDQMSRWVPAAYTSLGTDGFGRSDTREALRRFFENDAAHIVVAVLASLAEAGDLDPEVGGQGGRRPRHRPRRRPELDPVTELRYDVVVIGSGFGGSTTALRLTEKGYRVAVLEAGRRFDETTLPKTSWRLRSFLWAPKLGCYGIQRISLLKDVMILAGAGVGGGSLNYANTLYEPLPPFYGDAQWSHITDWQAELAPFYDQAKRMLGVVPNPVRTAADEVMQGVADDMGVGDTFRPTPVGVFFGEAGVEVDDPFFGGAGPKRRGCIQCGECMTGCRHGAKNTLLQNYLYLAERNGAEVHPMTTVTAIRPRAGGGYDVETRSTTGWRRGKRRTFVADDVIVAAGTMGTQKLLHRMRDEGVLPDLSSRLGELTRTNSEAILGARAFRRDVDFSRGVAITSSFHPDDHTHIEPVRYGKGSNAMGLLTTALADGGGRSRPLTWLRQVAAHPAQMVRNLSMRRWSEQTIIALVMQTRDNSITCYSKQSRTGWRLTSKQGHGEPNPTWIPAGHDAVRRIADRIGGFAGGGWNDVFNVPMTAHFLGGAPIGDSPATGVIDAYHRVYGHPGLHVVDGAAITANLGVNPSLTITAQAERAAALWPNRGEPDQRPPVGEAYRRLDPIAPNAPAVPSGAPAELRVRASR